MNDPDNHLQVKTARSALERPFWMEIQDFFSPACEQDEEYYHRQTYCSPEERLDWLVEYVDGYREFLPEDNKTIKLYFYPWQPGKEAVAELTLRDIKRQKSKTLKLRTCDGMIEFQYGTQEPSTDYSSGWPECDEGGVMEIIENFIMKFCG